MCRALCKGEVKAHEKLGRPEDRDKREGMGRRASPDGDRGNKGVGVGGSQAA